jgi:hypothetical protein
MHGVATLPFDAIHEQKEGQVVSERVNKERSIQTMAGNTYTRDGAWRMVEGRENKDSSTSMDEYSTDSIDTHISLIGKRNRTQYDHHEGKYPTT